MDANGAAARRFRAGNAGRSGSRATTLESYAKELEFFEIELAALGGGRPGIDYAFFENGSIQSRSADNSRGRSLVFHLAGRTSSKSRIEPSCHARGSTRPDE